MNPRLQALQLDPRFTRVPQETKDAIINALQTPDSKAEHRATQAHLNEALHYLLAQHAGKKNQADQLIICASYPIITTPFGFSHNDRFLLYWLAINQNSNACGGSSGGGGDCGNGEGCVVIVAAACACAAGAACVCANSAIWNTQESTSAKTKKTFASTLLGIIAFTIALYEFIKHDQWKDTWDNWGQHGWSDAGYFTCLTLIAASIGLATGAVTAATSLAIPCEKKPEPQLSKEAKLALETLIPVRELLNNGWPTKIPDLTTTKDDPFITDPIFLEKHKKELQAQYKREASGEIIEFVREAIGLYIQSMARPEHDIVLHGDHPSASASATPLLGPTTATVPSPTRVSTSSFATFAPPKSSHSANDITDYVALPANDDGLKPAAPTMGGR